MPRAIGIIKGEKGATGPAGPPGPPGSASTITVQPFASRALLAPKNGDEFIPTDGPMTFVYDGTLWRPQFADALFGTQPPAASNFTHIGSDATLVDQAGTLLFTSANADDIWQYNPPLATPQTIDFAFSVLWAQSAGGGSPVFGLILRDSVGGRFVRIGMFMAVEGGPFNLQIQEFTALGTPSTVLSTVNNSGIMRTASQVRLRVVWDGTNVSLSTTQNGVDYSPQITTAISGFVVPNRMGFFTANTSGVINYSRLLSFAVS